MKNLLILIGCVMTLSLSAQSNDTYNTALWDIMNSRTDHLAKDAIGSEYFFEKWQDLTLVAFGGKEVKLQQANINLVNSNIELIVNGDLNEIPEARIAKIVHYTNGQVSSTFFPLREFPELNNKKGVYQHYMAGNVEILVNHYILTIKPDPNAQITGGITKVKLNRKSKMYVKHKNKFLEFNKAKDLSKILGSATYKKLDKIAAENALDLKNIDDLVKGLKLIDTES